jgi:hypothetical protein
MYNMVTYHKFEFYFTEFYFPEDFSTNLIQLFFLFYFISHIRVYKIYIEELYSLALSPHGGLLGYGPFSLRVIHKEGLCPSSGGINRLMMMIVILCVLSSLFNY